MWPPICTYPCIHHSTTLDCMCDRKHSLCLPLSLLGRETVCTLTCTHIQSLCTFDWALSILTYSHIHSCVLLRSHTYNHWHIHRVLYWQIHTYTHADTHNCTDIITYTNTHKHTQGFTYTHRYTQTRTYTHSAARDAIFVGACLDKKQLPALVECMCGVHTSTRDWRRSMMPFIHHLQVRMVSVCIHEYVRTYVRTYVYRAIDAAAWCVLSIICRCAWCMCVCSYVCTYRLMLFACMFVSMYACMQVGMYVCMYACTYVCRHDCMDVCMFVCAYANIHECMRVCAKERALYIPTRAHLRK